MEGFLSSYIFVVLGVFTAHKGFVKNRPLLLFAGALIASIGFLASCGLILKITGNL